MEYCYCTDVANFSIIDIIATPMKKTLIILPLLLAVVLGGCTVPNSSGGGAVEGVSSSESQSTLILYSSPDCPHCLDLEQYIKENNIDEKLMIEKRQVGQNFPKHNQELGQRAQECGLPVDKVGIPFMYADGQCYLGNNQIILYLNGKIGYEKPVDGGASPSDSTQ